MSRRTNGTNRTGAMLNASRYTGYGKTKKKTASLAELNGHVNEKYNYQSTVQQRLSWRMSKDRLYRLPYGWREKVG